MQQRETGSRGTTSHAGSGHSSGQADPPAKQTTTAPRRRQYTLSYLEREVPEAQSLLQDCTPPAAQSDIFAGEIQTTARCRDTKNSCSLGESCAARTQETYLYGGIIGACDEIPPDMIQSFLEGFATWRGAAELCKLFSDQTEETEDRLAAALSSVANVTEIGAADPRNKQVLFTSILNSISEANGGHAIRLQDTPPEGFRFRATRVDPSTVREYCSEAKRRLLDKVAIRNSFRDSELKQPRYLDVRPANGPQSFRLYDRVDFTNLPTTEMVEKM